MRNKILGIFVCMLMITTCIVPVMANTTEDTPYVLSNDAAFDLKISFLMRIVGFPSLSTCIIKDDQIIWSKGYGYYDRTEQKPATTDTNYVIASITKTIVGTAIMQLYEQGLFELDDDVNAFLPFALRNPNFPNDPITFRMLLCHTSSLNENIQDQYYWFNFSGDPPFSFYPEPYLREYLLPGGRYYDSSVWNTTYRPGEYAIYANVGFEIIAYVVELISGKPFLEYCNTHIFSPLKMKNTSFNLSRLDINQVAIPYPRYRGRYYTINEMDILFGEDWTPPDKYWRPRCYPASGLYTTVNDLSHFLIAHMNDGVYNGTRILEKETVKLMHTPQPGNPIAGILWYGLAWFHETIFGMDVSGHSGASPGVNVMMFYNQTKNIGVIYLANGSPDYALPTFVAHPLVMLIYYLLFAKEGNFGGELRHESTVSSDAFFITPLIVPQSMSYEHIYD